RDPKATFLVGSGPAAPADDRVFARRLPRAALVLAHLALLAVLVARPAAAAPGQAPDAGYVSVIEVSGLLDRVLVDFVRTEIDDAERQGALALVLQLNSGGAVVADDRLDDLIEAIESAEVPVDVWV